ncbi:MAG: hypothetical protein ACRDH2_21105, partial [Anaerolineales bacterium]
DGASLMAQDDGPPANGLYPTQWWRGGDVVFDAHFLAAPRVATERRVIVGMYDYTSGERVRLRDGSGDFVAMPVP